MTERYTKCDVKRLIHAEEVTGVAKLRAKVVSAFEFAKSYVLVLTKLKRNVRIRTNLCIASGGGRFEQSLRVN